MYNVLSLNINSIQIEMKRYIAAVVMMVLSLQCTKQDPKTHIILENAAKCMEHHPDSSLAILNTLKLDSLPTQKERARYALLKSIALDKNYIDVTSDSLTSIALAYYKKHGTPDDKLKAYYYNGVICRNNNDTEKEMSNYIQAEKHVGGSKDYVYVGRLYNAKMMVYKEIFNVEKALEPAEQAARYYLKGKDTVRFITALNNLSSTLLSSNKHDSLRICFSKIQESLKYMTSKQKSIYYVNLINYKVAVSDSTSLETINEYISEFKDNDSLIRWHIIADAYLKTNNLVEAVSAIQKLDESRNIWGNVYHNIASDIYGAIGDYERAYMHSKIYQEASLAKDYSLFQGDTKFLEERDFSRQRSTEQKYMIIILLLAVIIAVLSIILFYYYHKEINNKRVQKIMEIESQKAQLADEYEKALAEQEKLRIIVSNKSLNPNIKKLLKQRLAILNKFIVSNISGVNMDDSVKELQLFLSNNDDFVKSTILSFKITHPKFISFLVSRGLSQWEIGCCCLYCIGLNGSEISNYLNIKYFYKNSSVIRKKLGIQSVNIDTFLLNKMKEMS